MGRLLVLIASICVSTFAQSKAEIPYQKFADFNGVRVHYETIGTGTRALAFVHGWTCSAEFWTESIAAFPEFRVIAVDLPGHGQSDKPRIDYTMDYFAHAIEAVMRDAQITDVVLVGHSMGVQVIRQFYRLYPERTLGLVIVDGTLLGASKAEMESYVAPFRVRYKESTLKLVDKMLQPIRDEVLREKIRSVMLATPDYVGLSAREGMVEQKIWAIDKINVPVLAILAGPWERKLDTERSFRSIASNLDFQMWHGASHFLMMEYPTMFNEFLRAFVQKNRLL